MSTPIPPSELDLRRLIEARHIVEEQRLLAHDEVVWRSFDLAARAVDRAVTVAQLYLDGTPAGPARKRRIEVPEEIFRRMLATGKDVWMADLLGHGRGEVQYRRRKYQITGFSRGGDHAGNAAARRRWETEWKSRLQAAGLWPNG